MAWSITAAIRYELGETHSYDFVEGSVPAELDPSESSFILHFYM
jgi:hypothetical protein